MATHTVLNSSSWPLTRLSRGVSQGDFKNSTVLFVQTTIPNEQI